MIEDDSIRWRPQRVRPSRWQDSLSITLLFVLLLIIVNGARVWKQERIYSAITTAQAICAEGMMRK